MPATAGRVRMPANNRVHSSAALQTHGIWQSAIGYDPYAPDQKSQPEDRSGAPEAGSGQAAGDQQNAYDSFQGLLALARLTGSNADVARGSCKKCGRVGHLSFQCRNILTVKEAEAVAAAAAAERGREGKGKDGEGLGSLSGLESSSEESSLTDSDEDSEMERIIATKYKKRVGALSKDRVKLLDAIVAEKKRAKSKKKRSSSSDESDGSLQRAEEEKRSSRRRHRESRRSGKSKDASRSRSKRHSRKSRDSESDSSDESSDAEERSRHRHRTNESTRPRRHGRDSLSKKREKNDTNDGPVEESEEDKYKRGGRRDRHADLGMFKEHRSRGRDVRSPDSEHDDDIKQSRNRRGDPRKDRDGHVSKRRS